MPEVDENQMSLEDLHNEIRQIAQETLSGLEARIQKLEAETESLGSSIDRLAEILGGKGK